MKKSWAGARIKNRQEARCRGCDRSYAVIKRTRNLRWEAKRMVKNELHVQFVAHPEGAVGARFNGYRPSTEEVIDPGARLQCTPPGRPTLSCLVSGRSAPPSARAPRTGSLAGYQSRHSCCATTPQGGLSQLDDA